MSGRLMFNEVKYGRDDVDYETWYSSWSKAIAKQLTKAEIEKRAGFAKAQGQAAAASHLRAIERTHSMTSNSQARAQSGNVARAAGDELIALAGAWEIHNFFPEHAKAAHD